MDTKFDLKLITGSDGSTASQSNVNYAELVYRIHDVKHHDKINPLRLKGGSFAVYQQLADKEKTGDSHKECTVNCFCHRIICGI